MEKDEEFKKEVQEMIDGVMGLIGKMDRSSFQRLLYKTLSSPH